MALRILFVPFGSEGDVNPLIWFARGMADRGHDVNFLLTPHYGRLADREGFKWIAMGTTEDFERATRNPLLWHPQKGPLTVTRMMVDSLPAYRETFEKLEGQFDLVVSTSFALAASALAEARNIPRLTVHLQPVCLRSEYDCPLFLPELAWISRAPRWVKKLFFQMVDATLWRIAKNPLDAFRRQLGLKPLKHFYDDAVNGADAIAALFPDWFAAPQMDWPRHLRQFDFPLNHDAQPLSPGLEAFLNAGEAPVVWTHGSANFDIQHFQARALETSERLGIRCLLVSLAPPPKNLPSSAFHASHVRFEDLFHRCRAIVHHGGIGTTAKALASGRPQLIIPRSHDQPDNANRVVRLGLGKTLTYRNLDAPALSVNLKLLLDSHSIQRRCAEYADRLRVSRPLPPLCEWAETLAAKG